MFNNNLWHQKIKIVAVVVFTVSIFFLFSGCSQVLDRFGIGKDENDAEHRPTVLEEKEDTAEDEDGELEEIKEPQLYIVNVKPGSSLSIRKTPGSADKNKDDVIDKFPKGWVFELMDKHENTTSPDNYTWWEVKDPSSQATGWVAKEYLDIPSNQPFTHCEFGLESIGLKKEMDVDSIIKVMGPPPKEEKVHSEIEGDFLLLYYDGLTLKIDDYNYLEYTISSPKYLGPRNIRTGDSFDSVISKFLKQSGNLPNSMLEPDAEPLYYIEEVEDGFNFAKEGYCVYDKQTGKPISIVYSHYIPNSGYFISLSFEISNNKVESITLKIINH